MKKVLLIDDMDERVGYLGLDKRTDIELTHTKTVVSSILCLDSADHFDEVWFDHDLGYDADLGRISTTMEIVNWIEEQIHVHDREFSFGEVIIHTANPVGESNIYNAMSKYFNTRINRNY